MSRSLAAGIKLTCFTSTKVQILTLAEALQGALSEGNAARESLCSVYMLC
jgi:hypothetical protein